MSTPSDAEGAVRLRFLWPEVPPSPWREDFYFGAWHPCRPLTVTWDPMPRLAPSTLSNRNWALLSSICDELGGKGLLHARMERNRGPQQDNVAAVAFRGYVTDPPIHSWSDDAQIIDYWDGDLSRTHNGVFSAVRIDLDGTRLSLISDAWGVGPLYWRRENDGLVLFSTSPRFLQTIGDNLSPLAARMYMHRAALCGDLSFVPGVQRVSPGSVLTFGRAAHPQKREWFSLGSLPIGDEPLNDQAVALAEEAFTNAVDRCLRLMPGQRSYLPLSSGDDSRRILVALKQAKTSFEALTVRVLQKDFRDLDARFASEMATRFGFAHRILELADPAEYAHDDYVARLLLSFEVTEHGWIAPLIRALGPAPAIVFDGLAGDIFGNTGFGVRELYAMDERRKLDAVAELVAPAAFSSVLRDNAWTTLRDVREYVVDSLMSLPEGPNRTDLAFLLIRARRGTGPCLQHLLPPGHVAVYPYLDIDHAAITLRYNPLAKIEQTLQARCLQRFWPEYYAVGGSRRIPAEVKRGSPRSAQQMQIARLQHLRSECGKRASTHQLVSLVRPKKAALAAASTISDALSLRVAWWLDPLLVLEAYRHAAKPAWIYASDT